MPAEPLPWSAYFKAYKDGAHVAVRNGNAQALRRKAGSICGHNPIALDMTPQLQRLLLALFLLAADVGDDIVQNIGEGLKGLPAPEIA